MVKMHSKLSFLVVTFFLTTLSLSAAVLSSSTVSAEDTHVDDVTVTVPASCTLSTTSGTGEIYQVAMANGQYKNDIGKTTITALCNTKSSFAIYAIGYSDDTYGNTNMVTTSQGALSFPTGTATSGITSNWAMKLEAVTASGANKYTPTIENGFDSFSSVPDTYTQVAKVDAVTGNTSEMSVKASYAVYLAQNQAAGTYTGKVRYTAIHPASEVPTQPQDCTANNICYWPNAVGVTDNMGDQGASANSSTVLWPTNFSRSGYGFAGWSDQFDYQINSNTNTGHIYGPMETITTPSDMSKGLSLYAVWVKSAGNLQGWTGCSTLAPGAVTALTDTRDNDTYAVAKLADGKCWMIENLRLDYDTNITTSNTQSYEGSFGGFFIGLAEPEYGNRFRNETIPNSIYYSSGSMYQVGNAYIDLGPDANGYSFPRYRNDNTNSDENINPNTTVSNMTTPAANIYSYGNYYSWAAAIADTTKHYGESEQSMSTSICPSGWHLPTGIANGEFVNLNTAVNSGSTSTNTGLRAYPANLLYAGYVEGQQIRNRGLTGLGAYWSATHSQTDFTHRLFFNQVTTQPTGDSYGVYGHTIRCIAD